MAWSQPSEVVLSLQSRLAWSSVRGDDYPWRCFSWYAKERWASVYSRVAYVERNYPASYLSWTGCMNTSYSSSVVCWIMKWWCSRTPMLRRRGLSPSACCHVHGSMLKLVPSSSIDDSFNSINVLRGTNNGSGISQFMIRCLCYIVCRSETSCPLRFMSNQWCNYTQWSTESIETFIRRRIFCNHSATTLVVEGMWFIWQSSSSKATRICRKVFVSGLIGIFV